MLRLTLFGPPALDSESGGIPFAAERRYQLLVFLACRPDWVSRDQLTALFWGEHPAAAARRNLRGLLFDLRQLSWLQGVESQGDSVRWIIPSDRRDFESQLAQQRWGSAVALVRGTFLEGMEINATAALTEWVRFEREWLLDRWRDAVDRHLSTLQPDPIAVVDAAKSALNLDPLNEGVVMALLTAHIEQGNHDAARRAYETYCAQLSREIGIEPSARLRARMQNLRDQPIDAKPAKDVTAESEHTGFIGRRAEVRELTRQLRREECRRVNVVGPGGIGKSSLARAVIASVAQDFPDGIHWIDLREIMEVSQIAARIAGLIALELRGERDAWTQIHARLRDTRVLLVLDNCEHLPQLGMVSEQLIAACPNLKILHTSRVRLGGRTESIFLLDGLPVPDEDEVELEAVRSFDAVRLFEVRAAAIAPAFDAAAHISDVAQLVREFGGLPLAIELAAACVRVMPVRAILMDLLNDLAKLDATATGSAPITGGRGLQASFQHSWRLLTNVEQRALAQLSIFAGSFDRVAAEHIAQASLPVLAALVDKSLVRLAESERLSLHPLVRHFAQSELSDDRAVRARHAEFFARYLESHVQSTHPERAHQVDLCLADCVAGWRWGCDARAAELITQFAAPLLRAFDESGRWSEGIDLFRSGEEQFDGVDVHSALARAEIARCLALLHYRRGEFDAAERRARESLRRITSCRRLHGVDECLNLIGGGLRQRGQWIEARRYFDRALRHARANGNAVLALRISNNIATVEMAMGNPERAIALCEGLLAEFESVREKTGVTMTCIILGNANHALQRVDIAQDWYERGLALADQNELVTLKPFFLQTLGSCHQTQGRVDMARDLFNQALASPNECLEPQVEIYALIGLARLDIADKNDSAPSLLRRALDIASRAQSPAWQMDVISIWARSYINAD